MKNRSMHIDVKKLFGDRRRTKHGSYSLALTAVVIAGAVLVNLVVSELPSQYTQIDVSSLQLSVLSDQTRELLSSLSGDMTIYYIVQDSNRDTYVSRLLDRYEDASAHIKVEEKDPVLYPKFASQYTDETLSENSVIIVCGDQSRVIAYEDMYESEFSYMYYSYTTTGFDAEGQITSAIAALDSASLPKMYTLTGHQEASITTALQSSIEKENIEVESLNLISAEQVPEDADLLLIVSPQTDFSDDETQKLLDYLQAGGRLALVTDYTGSDMPNLDSILEYYGMQRADGIVIEPDSYYYVQMPYYLLPEIEDTEVSGDMTGGSRYVLMAAAQGLSQVEELRDGLTVTSLLTTSQSSYSKTDVQNMQTYEKEDGDIDGPFALGMLASETVEIMEDAEPEEESAEDAEAESAEEAAEDAEAEPEEESAEDAEAEPAEEVTEGAEEEPVEEAAVSTEEESTAEATESVAEEESDGTAEETAQAETRLAVFTSSSLLDESADSMVSGGNYSLFINTLSWLSGSESSVSIPVKSLSMDYLTVPAASGNFWSIVVIGLIPGAFLVFGLYTWLRRRKQ